MANLLSTKIGKDHRRPCYTSAPWKALRFLWRAPRTLIIRLILRSTRRLPSCNHLPASLVHTTTRARNSSLLCSLVATSDHCTPLLCLFVFVALLEHSMHSRHTVIMLSSLSSWGSGNPTRTALEKHVAMSGPWISDISGYLSTLEGLLMLFGCCAEGWSTPRQLLHSPLVWSETKLYLHTDPILVLMLQSYSHTMECHAMHAGFLTQAALHTVTRLLKQARAIRRSFPGFSQVVKSASCM